MRVPRGPLYIWDALILSNYNAPISVKTYLAFDIAALSYSYKLGKIKHLWIGVVIKEIKKGKKR